jgi:hypothetical protein
MELPYDRASAVPAGTTTAVTSREPPRVNSLIEAAASQVPAIVDQGCLDDEGSRAPKPALMSGSVRLPSGSLGFGAKLQLAVKFTLLPRVLLSILFAHMLSNGSVTSQLVGLPVVTLVALQVRPPALVT